MKQHKTKVQLLKAKCGVYATAKYLKARGYTLQQAVILLASKGAYSIKHKGNLS